MTTRFQAISTSARRGRIHAVEAVLRSGKVNFWTGRVGGGRRLAHRRRTTFACDALHGRSSASGLAIDPPPVNIFRMEIEEFRRALTEDRELQNNPTIGLRSHHGLAACCEAARTGGTVEVTAPGVVMSEAPRGLFLHEGALQLARIGMLLAVWLFAAPGSAAEVRVGRAQVVITPPPGAMVGNSYGILTATGVSSDLHAKATVFEVNGSKAAIVSCDLISLRPAIVKEARAQIASKTGVDPERVILAATHCHAGPQMHPLFLELAPPEQRRINQRYILELPHLIAESVRRAEADLQPARIFAGRGREDSISFNRRFLLRDGTVRTNPGRMNPDLVRPMGPIDPEVGVIYVESAQGVPLVTLVNFALHVAIDTGSRISADFPHTLAQLLGRVKGDSMLTIFLNGMSGNINHIDFSRPREFSGAADAARVGTILAAAVLRSYPTLKHVDPAALGAISRPVRVPARSLPSATELEQARTVLRLHGRGARQTDVVRAWRALDLAELAADGFWPSEVQAIAFGSELAIVGYPGDSFVELGLVIKQNSPFALTLVAEQSGNGSISYIPNEKAYPEGGYEVESARVAPGGGEMLAAEAGRLLIELFPRPPP